LVGRQVLEEGAKELAVGLGEERCPRRRVGGIEEGLLGRVNGICSDEASQSVLKARG